MHKITRQMIEDGYREEIIFLINNRNDGCISAQIGENWFYFAGSENEGLTVDEYESEYTFDEIVDYIFNALDSGFEDEFPDEYWYYYYYLKENGIEQ